MDCEKCNHKIIEKDGEWIHKNYCFSTTTRKYYRLCGVVIRGKKFEEFKERWLKKYEKEYIGKYPICGCNKAEPKREIK